MKKLFTYVPQKLSKFFGQDRYTLFALYGFWWTFLSEIVLLILISGLALFYWLFE